MSDSHYPIVEIDNTGIVVIDYGYGGRVSLDAIQAAYKKHRILDIQPRPVLVRADSVISASNEAEEFASSPEVIEITVACGIVVRSLLSTHIGNVFLSYHKPPYPTRLFRDDKTAHTWLKGFI